MKFLLTILVAALAAFAGRMAGGPATRGAPQAGSTSDDDSTRRAVEELRAENRRLAAELERRESQLVPASAPANVVGEAEIAAALERWHAAHPPEERAAATVAARASARPVEPGEIDLATVPMSEIVRELQDKGFGNEASQELFQRLRELGRIDEYVAAMEALAAADPENADLQVALGHAYLQKLFGMESMPEIGVVAMKSDAAFDRALAIDDQNWGARFSKAVSLSNWPAFMGRGPEAIEHFEILLEQQEAQPKRPQFAMTYLFLGNVLQAGGKPERALATWRKGLELFPDREELRNAVELATPSDASRAPHR